MKFSSMVSSTLFAVLISSLTIFESYKPAPSQHDNPGGTRQIDTSKIVILSYSKDLKWIFRDAKPAQLSPQEYTETENILNRCIASSNVEGLKEFNRQQAKHPEYHLQKEYFIIDLLKYKRQYVVVTNRKNEKEIWINCFCDPPPYWRKSIVRVLDGGNCFFNLKVNLTKKRYYDFEINGEA